MKGNRLYKFEKLCSRTAINGVFAQGSSFIAYPLRVVYEIEPSAESPNAQFLITIPKKKIRTAVGRVLLRRRVRESYRLNRILLRPFLGDYSINIVFIYLSEKELDYASIDEKMKVALTRLANELEKKKAISHEENI